MYCMICKENQAGGDGLCVKCRFKMNTNNKDTLTNLEITLPEGRYVGRAKNGIPHGVGELTYNEHDSRKSYKGEFKDGMRHGKGKLTFRNDTYYDGEWVNDRYEGYGEEKLTGENTLEGIFVAGHLTRGHVYFGDGREYDGEWSDDMPNGTGKMYYRDGHSQEGYWVNGICAFHDTPTEEQIAQFLAEQEQRELDNPLEEERDNVMRQQNTEELPSDDLGTLIWNPIARQQLAEAEEDEAAPLLFDGMGDSPNVVSKSSQRVEPTKVSVARPVFRGNGFDGLGESADLEDEADALAKRMAEATAQTLVATDDSVADVDLTGGTAQGNKGEGNMIESSFVDTSDDHNPNNANSDILRGMYSSIGKPVPEELREKPIVKQVVSEKTLEDRGMQGFFAKMGLTGGDTANVAQEAAATVAEEAAKVETAVAETAEAVAEAAETAAAAAEETAKAPKKEYDPVTKTGYREETYANGEHYAGEFVNGKRHGIGRMEYANGDVYEGCYDMGKRHGQGIMIYAAGSRYEGNWENSIKSGQGRFIQSNGEVYEGNFANGTFDGTGSYQFKNGNVYIGDWKAGKREGKGVLIHADGTKEAQIWEGGKKILSEIVADPVRVEEETPAENAVEVAASAAETAVEQAANTAETAVEQATNAAETVVEQATQAADNVAAGVAAAVEEATASAENTVEETVAAAEATTNAAETAVENAAAPVAAVVEETAESAAAAAEAAAEAAEEFAAEPVVERESKTINFKSGNRYVGEVDEKNMPDGKGKFTYTNGSYYEGEFAHGVREGYGIFYWSTGDSYEGGWKKDKRHGEGVMKYANGRVRKGRFENNEYVGI